QLRADIMDKLRRSELATVDKVGRGNLYTLVSQESNHLSLTFPIIIDALQQVILLAVSLIYLAYLSPPALFAAITAAALGYGAYRMNDREFRKVTRLIQEQQGRMLDAIGDIIHGGKELRLNRKKSDGVFGLYQGE